MRTSIAGAAGPVRVTATAGNTGPTDYATLKLAFDAINVGTHQGAITINLLGNTTETAPAVLNASGSGPAAYTTIAIQPSGGGPRSISGAIAAGSPLIDLNGADNVTIDGLNSGGNALTISNMTAAATAGTSTIRFINGATNNLITNSTILGSFSGAATTDGGNIFFGTDASTPNGNDNNTISYNDIGPAGANLATKGIYLNGSFGTFAIYNNGIVIDRNNIFDYFSATVRSAGVFVTISNLDCHITNNRFYQTASRTQTGGAQHSAIWVNGGASIEITGNIIGFASNTGTGTYNFVAAAANSVFVPLSLNSFSSYFPPTTAQGNTIAGIAISGTSSGTGSSAPFRGINVSGSSSGGIGAVTGNTIGSQSATDSITYTSSSALASDVIAISNFGNTGWTVNSNQIGGITASNSNTGAANVYGIRVNTAGFSTSTLQNNTVGGTVANSLQSTTTTSGSQVVGIYLSNSRATVSGNTIHNLTAAGGTGVTTGASVIGINLLNASLNYTVTQNIIHSLTNTSAGDVTTITGIQYTSSPTGTNLVARNLLHSFKTTSSFGVVNGIQISGGTTTYQNNMIRLGVDSAGTSIVNGVQIYGINEIAGTDNIYFNSVSIGGFGVTSTANTFALQSAVTGNARNYLDNILVNSRQTTSGGGKNYAISLAGTTPNPAGLTTNFNVFNAPNSGGVLGLFNGADQTSLPAWRTATGQDSYSLDSNPQFINPSGDAASVNLHISSSVLTLIEGNGLAVGSVTDDFDGDPRANFTPVDIGADAGNFIGTDLAPPVIAYATLGNTTNATTRNLTNVSVTDNSGVNGTPGTKPRVYYKKSTNANAFNDNTNLTNGWKFVESNGTTSPFDFTLNYSLIFGGSVMTGDTIQYFVVAQDLVGTPNVGINSGTFAASPSSVALTVAAFPINGAINSYPITTTISGTKTACASGCDYTGLTPTGGLFADINSKVMAGNLTVNITGDLLSEDGANALNQWAEEGVGNYTLIIQSSGGARMISGTSPNTGALIDLNGADRVTIDGINSGGNSLLIRNTTNPAAAIRLFNDASNNSILNCTIEGGTAAANPVVFIGTGTLTGNDNNTISGNVIRNRSDVSFVPSTLVGSFGSSSAPNSNNVLSNNQLKNFSSSGFAASAGNDSWTVTGNNIFEESSQNFSLNGINFASLGTNVISGNVIHDLNTSQGAATGIFVFGTDSVTISGNRIYNFLGTAGSSAALVGMNLQGSTGPTSLTTVVNNIVSIVPSFTNDQSITGIQVFGSPGNTFDVFHNSIYIGGTASLSSNSESVALLRGFLSQNSYTAKNNIAFNNRTGGFGNHLAVGDRSPSTGTFVSDFNFYAGTGTTAANFMDYGSTAVSFATWQAGPPARDANSIAGTAASFAASNFFVDAGNGDLHLKPTALPVLGGGTSLPDITSDFDNDPRPAVNRDIGADELVEAVGGVIPGRTFYNVAGATNDTLGGNVTVTGTLWLTGKLLASGGDLTIDCDATVNGASDANYVIAKMTRKFCAPGPFSFPIGSANAYAPVDTSVTSGNFPATITVETVQGSHPNVDPDTCIKRYWRSTNAGVTANLTFHYNDPLDVMGNEANYRLIRVTGGTTRSFVNVCPVPPSGSACVNPAANTALINAVTNSAAWTIGQPGIPTADSATISGRVVTSEGSPLGGVTINLSGNAWAHTITNGDGRYRFDNLPTNAFYSVTPALVNYSFSPASRSFALIGNQIDAGFTASADASPGANAIDTTDFFVRQQYLDFLGREPDMGGWLYWTSRISACGNNQLCINQRRIEVSAAFFASEEFQQTGSFIYRLYQTGLGRQLNYAEFNADRPRVLAGADLETNRTNFANEFVTRPEFSLKYQYATTADTFVDALLVTVMQSTGLDLSAQREALLAEYSQGEDQAHSRSRALRTLSDNSAIKDAAYNPSFVLMEYFGYLRRDVDRGGYDFWLDVLNNGAPGNYRGMVCAFLTSTEYQLRFSTVVTRSNAECGP